MLLDNQDEFDLAHLFFFFKSLIKIEKQEAFLSTYPTEGRQGAGRSWLKIEWTMWTTGGSQ